MIKEKRKKQPKLLVTPEEPEVQLKVKSIERYQQLFDAASCYEYHRHSDIIQNRLDLVALLEKHLKRSCSWIKDKKFKVEHGFEDNFHILSSIARSELISSIKDLIEKEGDHRPDYSPAIAIS